MLDEAEAREKLVLEGSEVREKLALEGSEVREKPVLEVELAWSMASFPIP